MTTSKKPNPQSKKRINKTGGKKKSFSYNLQSPDMDKPIKLKCEVDKHDKFYKKTVTINSGRLSTFFEMDWLFDKSAQMLICDRCSTIRFIKNKKFLKEI